MRKLVSAAILGVAITAAAPALAQDDTGTRSPFTGPRVEIDGGWDHTRLGRGDHRDGFTGGVGVGYDFQVGHFVAGVEGEASDSTTHHRINNYVAPGDTYKIDAGRDLYAGGRIGVQSHGTLFYAKGGYTNARFNTHYTPAGGALVTDARNLEGYRVGGGIEKMMSRHAFMKVEYRYSHYGSDHGDLAAASFHPDRHQVVGGVGIRF